MSFPQAGRASSPAPLARALTVEPAAVPRVEAHAAETYYPLFDWLRILLAFVVVLSHASVVGGEHTGDFAVQVFFALSGWLIGGILLRTEPSAMLRFYYARATRIWIPYTAALVLLLGLSVLRDPIGARWLEFVFYKATFVYNLFGLQLDHMHEMPLSGAGNHFWSICVEEQFYLLAPLLLVFWPKVGRSPWLWLLLLVGLLSIGQYGSISAGVLAAVVHQRIGPFHQKPLVQVGLLAVVLVSAALMLAEVLPYRTTAPFTAVAIVLLAARAGAKQKVSGFLGGLSYPLYLNHWLGLYVGHALVARLGFSDPLAHAALGVPLALATSTLLYLLVDRAVLARRNRWYSPRLGRSLTIAAYGLMVLGLAGGFWIQHAREQAGEAGEPGEAAALAADSTINAAPIR